MIPCDSNSPRIPEVAYHLDSKASEKLPSEKGDRRGGRIGTFKARRARYVLAGVLALDVVAVVAIVWYVRDSRRAVDEQLIAAVENPPVSWRENVAKPIVSPTILKPAEAGLRPDELVIGVEVGGRARAYALSAFDHPMGHLVNDMIGGVAVSVAYCNLSRCVKVYTDPGATAPLDAEIAGVLNREMVIKLRGTPYFQSSGAPMRPAGGPAAIPYDLLTPTVMKWNQWTQRHPDTDVYEGKSGVVQKESMLRPMP